MSYEVNAGVINVTFPRQPTKTKVAAILIAGISLSLALIYAYAFVLPDYVGFETSVLIGIAAIYVGVT